MGMLLAQINTEAMRSENVTDGFINKVNVDFGMSICFDSLLNNK